MSIEYDPEEFIKDCESYRSETKEVRDCTQKTQTVCVYNQGKPDIVGNVEDVTFCIPNLQQTEIDEFDQKINVYYDYKIGIDENGSPMFVCTGKSSC